MQLNSKIFRPIIHALEEFKTLALRSSNNDSENAGLNLEQAKSSQREQVLQLFTAEVDSQPIDRLFEKLQQEERCKTFTVKDFTDRRDDDKLKLDINHREEMDLSLELIYLFTSMDSFFAFEQIVEFLKKASKLLGDEQAWSNFKDIVIEPFKQSLKGYLIKIEQGSLFDVFRAIKSGKLIERAQGLSDQWFNPKAERFADEINPYANKSMAEAIRAVDTKQAWHNFLSA